MRRCEFELKGKAMSLFKMGRLQYRAFSGQTGTVNRREDACKIGGPIPAGNYYIVQRESLGLATLLTDYVLGKDKWFALYASDLRIDDEVFCNRVKRTQLRLHPKGPRGRSEGCVTLDSPADFARLRNALLRKAPMPVPGSRYRAYGLLEVR